MFFDTPPRDVWTALAWPSKAATLWLAIPLTEFALFAPGVLIAYALARPKGAAAVSPLDILARGIFLSLFLTYVIWWAFFLDRDVGKLASLAFLLSPVVTAAIRPAFAKSAAGTIFKSRETLVPLAMMALLSIFFMGNITALLPNLSPLVVAGRAEVGQMPSDNALPYWFANCWFFTGCNPRTFLGEWLGSDRPPLQAAASMVVKLIGASQHMDELYYQITSVLLQALWIPAVAYVLRLLDATRRQAFCAYVLLGASSFVYVNQLFVWPKMVGGALWLLATAMLLWKKPAPSVGWAGLGFGLAMLCHGTSAFALLGVACLAPFLRRRVRLRDWTLVFGIVALIQLPWMLYQKLFDPPGDRLLKWHLAGMPDPNTLSIREALAKAYGALTPMTWLEGRWQNIANMWADFRPLKVVGLPFAEYPVLRNDEFFHVANIVGLWAFGIAVLAALAFRRRLAEARLAGQMAAVIASALLVWCVTVFMPGTAIIHTGPYGVFLLLAVLCAVGVGRLRFGLWVPFALYSLVTFLMLNLVITPMGRPAEGKRIFWSTLLAGILFYVAASKAVAPTPPQPPHNE